MQIAVIGGGAATVCLLDALAQPPSSEHALAIYEPSPHLWRGRPYRPDSSAVRVNSPPEEMSVRAGDRGHFARWLDARCSAGTDAVAADPWSGVRFAPRAVYGEYLENAADAAIGRLRARGWRVEIVRASVTAAKQTPDGVVLHASDGRSRAADHAVLCVGGDRPADSYGLSGKADFVTDPYPTTRALAGIRPDQHVAVLGSGLSAVDVVMALAAREHRGSITMVSRNGALPPVRQRPVPHVLRYFTPDRLCAWAADGRQVAMDELVELLHSELVDAAARPSDIVEEIRTVGSADPAGRLRTHIDAVNSTDLGLRILQQAVPDSGQQVWRVLPAAERELVMRRHFRTVLNLCCPMPPRTAATLLRLLDAGQLKIVRGVQSVQPRTTGGFDVHAETDTGCDIVVNAVTTSEHRIPRAAGSVVDSLVDAGLAERHPHGGLAIEPETSRLTVGEVPRPNLFALGDVTFGALLFTFGIPVLVDRAVDIVHTILGAQTEPHDPNPIPVSLRHP